MPGPSAGQRAGTAASALPQETIRRKRDGAPLSEAEIAAFVAGIADGSISDGQVAALAMAVFFRGMDRAETVALTRAMTRSGVTLDWSSLGRPVLDKHSTGGVGDKVSLVLAPLLACCGAAVPMVSGRGLGHTGGTVDKLESIPGYDAAPDLDRFRAVVAEAGCAIVGQTADLAPADRRFYAVRDTTATVESVPLITASILSKKLAVGLHGLVLDVKVGSGAFAATHAAAQALGESLVAVADGAGLRTVALLTDMDQVLGRAAGNALEVAEAIAFLVGGGAREPRLRNLVLALGAEALLLGRLADTVEAARTRLQRALDDGSAAERFQHMVRALGGPGDLVAQPLRYLPAAPVIRPVAAPRAGVVARIDVRALGVAVVALGGGRRRPEDRIDPRVGFGDVAAVGETVGPERPLAVVHARDPDGAAVGTAAVQAAFTVGDLPVLAPGLIRGRVDAAAAQPR